MSKLPCLMLLPLLAGCGAEHSGPEEGIQLPPLSLHASVDTARPTTGDSITYRVVVEHDERLEASLPEFGAAIAGLRVVAARAGERQRAGGRLRQSFEYELRADLAQVYIIPAIELVYPRPTWYQGDAVTAPAAGASDLPPPISLTLDAASDDSSQAPLMLRAATSPIFIEVASRLGDGSSMLLRDIKPLPPVGSRSSWIFILAALLLGGGLLAFVLLRRGGSAGEQEELAAHVLAYYALEQLEAMSVEERAALRLAYYRLSGVLRTYLELRFGINATDLTTQEIAPRLFDLPMLDEPHRRLVMELLRDFDAVKYADMGGDESTWPAALKATRRFVDDTRELRSDLDEDEED